MWTFKFICSCIVCFYCFVFNISSLIGNCTFFEAKSHQWMTWKYTYAKSHMLDRSQTFFAESCAAWKARAELININVPKFRAAQTNRAAHTVRWLSCIKTNQQLTVFQLTVSNLYLVMYVNRVRTFSFVLCLVLFLLTPLQLSTFNIFYSFVFRYISAHKFRVIYNKILH